MENSELLLFFFIYNIILTIGFVIYYIENRKKYNDLDKYNEELIFELAKLRRKCYSKDKEE